MGIVFLGELVGGFWGCNVIVTTFMVSNYSSLRFDCFELKYFLENVFPFLGIFFR